MQKSYEQQSSIAAADENDLNAKIELLKKEIEEIDAKIEKLSQSLEVAETPSENDIEKSN